MDELIEQFIEIAPVTRRVAAFYLVRQNGNLNNAISDFFENGDSIYIPDDFMLPEIDNSDSSDSNSAHSDVSNDIEALVDVLQTIIEDFPDESAPADDNELEDKMESPAALAQSENFPKSLNPLKFKTVILNEEYINTLKAEHSIIPPYTETQRNENSFCFSFEDNTDFQVTREAVSVDFLVYKNGFKFGDKWIEATDEKYKEMLQSVLSGSLPIEICDENTMYDINLIDLRSEAFH